jgi:hypothetical protein
VTIEPDFDRVADVLIHVALRLSEHDESDTEGGQSADTGVLSRLD